MTLKFLLFRGSWTNEGKFYAIESERTIILLAVGKDCHSSSEDSLQQINYDYLKENCSKLKAIVINNTNFQNVGLLARICQDLGKEVAIYTSVPNKLILCYLFPQIRNKINILTSSSPTVEIDDFTCSFFPLNSYLIGNCIVALHHSNYSFYLIEELLMNNCQENELLFTPNFLPNLFSFLSKKREKVYLITSFSNIKWNTNNSLFLAPNDFSPLSNKYKKKFWILYEFDWLHILELLAIAYNHHQKIRIVDERFLLLVRQLLAKNYLWKVISEEGEIILLVVDYTNIRIRLDNFLERFSLEEKSKFHFFVAIPPVSGGEERLAKIIDFLRTQSEEVSNLSKSECFNYNTSFSDWKQILQLLQPQAIILLQNSYKNSKYLNYLSNRYLHFNNQYFCQFPTEKISFLKTKKTLMSLEEILVKQRSNLWEEGLLIIFLLVKWQEEILELKKLELELFGVNLPLSAFEELKEEIKKKWIKNLILDLNKEDSTKVIKEAMKKRVNEMAKSYLVKKHNIELEEIPVLLFF